MDAEFGHPGFINALLRYSVSVNVASAREHVAGIERKTRTLKERVRARRSQMPYLKIPKIMTSDLVRDVVAWLNQFPTKSSLIPSMGARTLITGVQFDYHLHCRVEFGQYCEVHEDRDKKNSVEAERTTRAIAMKSSGNLQGGYRFLSLRTGRVLPRQHFTVCPITTQVIDRVHELATRDGVLSDEEELVQGSCLQEVNPTNEEPSTKEPSIVLSSE